MKLPLLDDFMTMMLRGRHCYFTSSHLHIPTTAGNPCEVARPLPCRAGEVGTWGHFIAQMATDVTGRGHLSWGLKFALQSSSAQRGPSSCGPARTQRDAGKKDAPRMTESSSHFPCPSMGCEAVHSQPSQESEYVHVRAGRGSRRRENDMQGIRRWVAPLTAMLIVLPVLITGCGGPTSDDDYRGGDDSDQYENVTP